MSHPPKTDRRSFLTHLSSSALVLAAHRHLAWALPADESQPRAVKPSPERILRLRLSTAAPLSEMKAFYQGRLGLPVLGESEGELTIAGGATPITFVAAKPGVGAPFYHFAFNIPENKLRDARIWQLERSELLPVFPQQRDPAYPDDVIHFRHWNAHSVFFLDPAGNVVEYIARHDLGNASGGAFSQRDILYASEIAFVVDDVSAGGGGIKDAFDLPQYRGASDQFMAIGDEHGLLLVFKRGRSLSLAHPVPKLADVFSTAVEIRGTEAARHSVPDFPYEILSRDRTG